MSDLFESFVTGLEQVQGQALTLSEAGSFAYLLQGDLAIESTLSDDGRYLVTDAWVCQTNDLPAAQHALLLGLLLEMNGYAGLMRGAIFSLDVQGRMVLTLAHPLAQLTAHQYLAKLHDLLEQTRQMRQIVLMIYPVITLPGDEDRMLPDRR